MSVVSAIVKYPASAADQPDKRFCGQCGRLCQPLLNDNVGFGPCVDDADSPLECPSLQQAIAGSYSIARFMGREVHPDTKALVARLGIPQAIVAEWVAKAERVSVIKAETRSWHFDDASPLRALSVWVSKGDSDERLLALIEELRVHLDPTEGATQRITFGSLAQWHSRLAQRASDILSDPGDWEPDTD